MWVKSCSRLLVMRHTQNRRPHVRARSHQASEARLDTPLQRVLSRRAPTRATKGISVDEKGALCAYFFGWNLPPLRTLVAHKQKAHGGGKDGDTRTFRTHSPDVVHGTCRCVRGSQLIMADYSPTGVGSWETEGVWGDVTSVCWPVATDEELHAARDIWLNQVRGNVCMSVHTNTK